MYNTCIVFTRLTKSDKGQERGKKTIIKNVTKNIHLIKIETKLYTVAQIVFKRKRVTGDCFTGF